ncbi:hypothetical protein VTN49DRAFT_6686 [Thermomyces lanuginosus]|uniref:uncharacterized protein n=1 Tax=Thermomyces lanuginosus TaxID=5541 RepID=UPI00374348F0
MGTYRLEEAPSGRAGCQNKECKDQKIKIQKGELRVGTWIDTERFQSWSWRHWGCTTPKVIKNIQDALGEPDDDGNYDVSMLDGFEELSQENQEKVKRALKQGHVDDEEWRGDVEMNRPGSTGFRKKASKKDKGKEEKEKGGKKASKKRSHNESEDEDEKPEKKAKVETADYTGRKRGRPRKVKEAEPESEPEAAPETESQPKKRGRKKKAADKEAEPEEKDDKGKDKKENGEKPVKKRGRPRIEKKPEPEENGKKTVRKRGRPKKTDS